MSIIEEEIDAKQAELLHGIIARHSKLPNGELRFRLLKTDGTAYIRTESAPQGEWQNAHWHKMVLETYIVQSGWIGYAEWLNNKLNLYVYREGQSFTTKPEIIHNLYVPQGAVIHTVKHGDATGEKRLAGPKADKITKLTKAISETEILALAVEGVDRPLIEGQIEFGEVYRHFDNLIWQSAAWSSAVFALGLAGMTQLTAESPFVQLTGIGHSKLIAAICAMFGLFIIIISHALYRFRWHQKRQSRSGKARHWPSPQFGLQTMTNVQGLALLGFSLLLIGWPLKWIWLLAATLSALIAMAVYQEGKIYSWLWRFGERETQS